MLVSANGLPLTQLSLADWQARAHAHVEAVGAYADAFIERRSRGAKHPVHDFLFTYYSFAPTRLKQWLPAYGQAIEWQDSLAESYPWLVKYGVRDGAWLRLDTERLDERVRSLARFIVQLCGNILERPAHYRCYGLHEWAMVYQMTPQQVRHSGYSLRLPPAELAAFIESQSLCCSHYDAFRFFTPEAVPRNAFQPTLDSRLQLEQGACLHANMDLYKWAHKLWPWIGSDLIAETFALALAGRDLDMRASPYDLAALGYAPIAIETASGREQYECQQRALAERARPVRERLRAAALELSQSYSQQMN